MTMPMQSISPAYYVNVKGWTVSYDGAHDAFCCCPNAIRSASLLRNSFHAPKCRDSMNWRRSMNGSPGRSRPSSMPFIPYAFPYLYDNHRTEGVLDVRRVPTTGLELGLRIGPAAYQTVKWTEGRLYSAVSLEFC